MTDHTSKAFCKKCGEETLHTLSGSESKGWCEVCNEPYIRCVDDLDKWGQLEYRLADVVGRVKEIIRLADEIRLDIQNGNLFGKGEKYAGQ